jgi:hypothetical protein
LSFTSGAGPVIQTFQTYNIAGPSQEELWKIREAISKASSLEEVERLNRLLQSGQIPGRGGRQSNKGEYKPLLIYLS